MCVPMTARRRETNAPDMSHMALRAAAGVLNSWAGPDVGFVSCSTKEGFHQLRDS